MNKLKTPAAPPYAARFRCLFGDWDAYDHIWVFEIWALSCVPRRVLPRVLWNKDTLMGKSFLEQAHSSATRVSARWITRYELRLLPRVRWTFMSNRDEIARLGLSRVSLLPHGIDRIHVRRPGWRSEPDLILGFAGLLAYRPNRNGLLGFLRYQYPEVRRAGAHRGKRVRLVVAGQGLSRSDRELVTQAPDVTLLGYVDDIGTFYAEIDVALAPMTEGVGAATKVMEALAYGVPILGTPTGLRGVDERLMNWTVEVPQSRADGPRPYPMPRRSLRQTASPSKTPLGTSSLSGFLLAWSDRCFHEVEEFQSRPRSASPSSATALARTPASARSRPGHRAHSDRSRESGSPSNPRRGYHDTVVVRRSPRCGAARRPRGLTRRPRFSEYWSL